MILLDTSGLLAVLDGSERSHAAATRALEDAEAPLVLSPFVLAELDYLLGVRVGAPAERAFLADVAAGSYALAPFDAEDVRAAGEVIDRFQDLHLGLADASIAVLADRHGIGDLLTLDHRHFAALRTAAGRSFRLLPAGG